MDNELSKKFVVFAGTNEGRRICEFLSGYGARVTACVATEYGSLVMPALPSLTVQEGRLSSAEIDELIADYDYVIDATHPYAEIISSNIRMAVKDKKTKYIRIIRPAVGYENVIECENIVKACEYLNTTTGNVLVTTGSKELKPYTLIDKYHDRLFCRVLPTIEAISACSKLGFNPSNIICMQGPFSEKMNSATLEQINAKYLVTKETGTSGGFSEKLIAAKKMGVKVILIGRPYKEEGLCYEQACELLKKELSLPEHDVLHFPVFLDISKRKIIVIGGGKIGTRRIKSLLAFSTNIMVVSPQIDEELENVRDKICIKYEKYDEKYLDDAFIVIAATNSREVNQKIYEDAKKKNILVNVSDKKEQCDFYFPAIFYNDEVLGGLISIDGENHKIAKERSGMIMEYLNRGRISLEND